ncbi:hypothetical protein K504DRAFT_383222 [Pleomassaria siparia CBS 279.74]|uniref:Uncharacterized protein n=1 Tax=Pleomassaria siparia CBS 279.74 TaxID=1314801 RepID=A0A6G1K5H7_9PLEO|nr:hypothetical protein K504DRAFT_383222 [Pleomassaria siparia CBS 279.74]
MLTLDSYHSTKKNREESPLLCLPAEIRNHIFSYALGGRMWVILWRSRRSSVVKNREENCLSLLQTCRQVYAETALLPFELGTFRALPQAALQRWLRMRPRRCREAVESLDQ